MRTWSCLTQGCVHLKDSWKPAGSGSGRGPLQVFSQRCSSSCFPTGADALAPPSLVQLCSLSTSCLLYESFLLTLIWINSHLTAEHSLDYLSCILC